jgi:DNA polymerase/3'-5' exonuclease PolX
MVASGFYRVLGEKTETNILQAIEAHANQTQRFKLAVAAQYAEALEKISASDTGCSDCYSCRQLSAHA